MAAPRSLPELEDLHYWFSYHPDEGYLRWRKRTKRINVGDIAGSPHFSNGKPTGYLEVQVQFVRCLVHRAIWKWMTGEDPKGDIDHRDGNPSNNRWANLRDVTKSQNMMNVGPVLNKKSGLPKGVMHRFGQPGKFIARIKVNHRYYHLGTFVTPEAAHAAYCKAATRLHGEFAHAVSRGASSASFPA